MSQYVLTLFSHSCIVNKNFNGGGFYVGTAKDLF